jgi:hypothetical protein
VIIFSVVPEQKGAAMANEECLSCGKKFQQKEAAVKCSICSLWCHKACSGLTNDFFKCLADQYKATKRTYWACRSCGNYAESMTNKLREIQETATEAIRIGTENSEEIVKLKDRVEKEKERADKAVARLEKEMQEEMTRREERRKNIVLHGLQESMDTDGRRRMEADKRKLDEVFTIMDVSVAAENDVEFCRRAGEKSDRPRPLIVGFYMEWSKEICLKHAKRLMNSNMSEVTIVPDLTEKQRKAERELEGEAARKNRDELSEEDISKNLIWKVVGKKGQKRLMKGYNNGTDNGGQWTQVRGRAGLARAGTARGGVARGGASQVPVLGVQLLPQRGAPSGAWAARHRGTTRPAERVAREGGEQEAERSSSRKRTRQGSNEEQQTRAKKRGGRGVGRPPRARGTGRGAALRMGEEEEDEEEETVMGPDLEEEEVMTQTQEEERMSSSEEEMERDEAGEELRLGESQQQQQ